MKRKQPHSKPDTLWSRFLLRGKVLPSLLAAWILLAILADVIATDRPWAIKTDRGISFPAFTAILNPNKVDRFYNKPGDKKETIIDHAQVDWKQMDAEWVIWAPIPWSHEKPDAYNRDFASPGGVQKIKTPEGKIVDIPLRFRHLMGTDRLGRDLFSMLIHASRISLKIGIISTMIAGIIGLILGALSGYFGNNRVLLSRIQLFFAAGGFSLGIFWAFVSASPRLQDAFQTGGFYAAFHLMLSVVLVIACSFLPAYLAGKVFTKQKKYTFPLDNLIQRFSEVFSSMPKILILLTLAAVLKDRGVGMVIAIIGFTGWTSLNRYTRSEMLRIRELPYIENARIQGISSLRILFKHALPNALGPVIVELSFLVSASILAESSLSFLGIGVPVEVATWGSILSEGRQDLDAWWMVVFPGMAIFATVVLFNALGRQFRQAQLNRQ